MFINNSHWQSSEIIIFLCKYYVVISDTVVGFFLDVFFLLIAVILSELHEKPARNKAWVTEKSTQNNLCEGHHFFDCTPSFLCHFLLLSLSTLLPKWRTCWMAPIKKIIFIWVILCVHLFEQSIFDPRPENRLNFSKKLPPKIV